jgi:predicted amidophosphoribosyltransferase
MALPVELFLAFTLVAGACERCGAAVDDGETVCRECGEGLDAAWPAELQEDDDVG